MKRAVCILVLVVSPLLLGLTESCGGTSLIEVTYGDGGNRDGSKGCGGSGEPCCGAAACDNGLMCKGGTCGSDGEADSGSCGGTDARATDGTVTDARAMDAGLDASHRESGVDSAPDVGP